MVDEITHSGIIIWVVGLLGVAGGIVSIILATVIRTLKGAVKEMDEKKQSRELCDLLHKQISTSLVDIKDSVKETSDKLGALKEHLVKIETILEHGQSDETKRYDKHTKEWKEG